MQKPSKARSSSRPKRADGLPTLEDLDRVLARRSLSHYVRAAWHVLEPLTALQWSWHLDAVCSHVQALLENRPGPSSVSPGVTQREGASDFSRASQGPQEACPQNLLLNVPPGTMKSLIVSVFSVSWKWLDNPSYRWICSSGSPRVVTRDSLKCRDLIRSNWYQETFEPDWTIKSDQDEKQLFANTKGGFRQGTAAGATVTGDRADCLLIDDPSDAKEIHSKAHREAINDRWWTQAFHNRIADPTASKRILIMQRLHEQDLAGYLIDKEGDHAKGGAWEHLSIPMEHDTSETAPGSRRGGVRKSWLGWSDPRKVEGELLFPSRFTPTYLAAERLSLGSSAYAGQMQQRPVPSTGNKFQRSWWRFWSPTGTMLQRPEGCSAVAPRQLHIQTARFDEVLGSWDCAFKDTDGSDFVVGIVVARLGADKFILACDRARRGLTETQKAVLRQKVDWPAMWEILIEDKANGTAVVETLKEVISGLIEVEPMGGKESRAAAMEPEVEAGNWYLPEGAEWLGDWVDEFASFPLGKNDDIVDACSQAAIHMKDSDVGAARALLGMVG